MPENGNLHRAAGGRGKNQSKAQQVKSKNPFFPKIFTPFLTSSYENQESRIKNLFHIKRACSSY